MPDLAAQIREQLSPMPTVDEWGQWAHRAYDAIMAVLDEHEAFTITGGEFEGRKVCKSCGDTADEHLAVSDPCPTKVAIAEKLGIEVDRG